MTPKEIVESIKAICQFSADNDGDTSHIEDGISEVCLENIGIILAALEAYEPWVKCADRMPEIDEYVLWHDQTGTIFTECLDKDDTEMLWTKRCTHWKPLPKPPEEK